MEQRTKDSHMADAAIGMGAEVVSETAPDYNKTKGIKDVLGDGKMHFFEELPKIEFAELLGNTFVIRQVKYVDKWDSVYGVSSFYLLLIELNDGRKLTTLAGGKAIINQLNRMGRIRGSFPCKVTLNQKPSAQGDYYLFE